MSSSQETLKTIETAIEALRWIDLDALKDAIREELMAEVRDEIRDELASAAAAAEDDDAPEIGTEQAWGKDDAAGLNAFLVVFDQNW